MKIYKLKNDIVIEKGSELYLVENTDWNIFINDDSLWEKLEELTGRLSVAPEIAERLKTEVEAPLKDQEIWASGVTYSNSKLARQAESKEAGGGQFYAKVYVADRPEIFFKATAMRTVGPEGEVRIRKDSTWDVPEPELTLILTSSGKIVGYTIGNDMSSRSIEGENPLYLPQAKTYDGSASVGPCIYVSNEPLPENTAIKMQIIRSGSVVFKDEVEIREMHRKPQDLADWLFKECSFPYGCLLMTGTGIVPTSDFTLKSGDEIRIEISSIGVLVNTVG